MCAAEENAIEENATEENTIEEYANKKLEKFQEIYVNCS